MSTYYRIDLDLRDGAWIAYCATATDYEEEEELWDFEDLPLPGGHTSSLAEMVKWIASHETPRFVRKSRIRDVAEWNSWPSETGELQCARFVWIDAEGEA